MGTKLNKLVDIEEWKSLKDIVVFGYGRQGKRMLRKLQRDFHIVAIVDNNREKCGMNADGVPVIHFQEAVQQLRENKIIVTTATYHYNSVRRQLEGLGLVENKDFVLFHSFAPEWYYKCRQNIFVAETDVSLTPVCNLNCEKCSMFVPYWKNKKHREPENIKNDLDTYFKYVDFVFNMSIIGGEPLIYKKLDEILKYIGEHYRDRIGCITIITNGTVVPDDKILALLKRYEIEVSVSDYSDHLPYGEKVEKLCSLLEAWEISYMRNTNIEWFDFGFPEKCYHYEAGEEAKKHMQNCNIVCHMLQDGRLYYCATAWAAQLGGLFKEDDNSYIDLNKLDIEDREKGGKAILELCLGNIPRGYLELCRVCGGYGVDNTRKVETARQKNRQE